MSREAVACRHAFTPAAAQRRGAVLHLMAIVWRIACAFAVAVSLRLLPAPAQTTDKSSVLTAINQVRLSNGLTPLAVNPALEKAAQQHSDDMAGQSFVDHTGSNGSSPVDRLSAAGYPAWQDTRVWAESIYAGSHGFTEALDYFMKDDAQRRNLLASRYREVGIGVGVSTNANGVQMVYWTLDFGSQPNVLPIFINDGVTLINTPQVAIHLTQEDAVPGGEGAAIGRIIDVRISSESTFKNAAWQPWEPLIPFTFDSKPGLKSVYVQMRDGGGRVTASTASVQYDPNSTPQVAPVAPGYRVSPVLPTDTPAEATPTPAPARTAQAVATSGREPAATALPTSPAIIAMPSVTVEVAITASPRPPTREPRTPKGEAGATIPDAVFVIYLIGQTLLIAAGIYGFFHSKASAVAKPPNCR